MDSYSPYRDNPFNMIKNREVVFFDTETTGISPRNSQITEFGAIICSGDTLEQQGQYHSVVELNPDTIKNMDKPGKTPRDKTIADLLNMTGYHDHSGPKVSERTAIEQFYNFIPEGAVMVAHNAAFDLKMINTRAKNNGLKVNKKHSKVLDTMMMSRMFFIPMLQELKMEGDTQAIQILKNMERKWTRAGKSYSSSLGSLATAITPGIENWHSALADVKTTYNIFVEFKKFFEKHFDSELKYNHDFISSYMKNNFKN